MPTRRRKAPPLHRQVAAGVRNGLLRPGPDGSYADADDESWRSIDWPSLTRRLRIRGRELNVVDTGGDKPPLLFVHGWGANWQSWLLNISAFIDGRRCIAMDLPGFGGSEMPDGEISISGYAAVVDELCGELEVENPVVVGNSMGGFVGAELAISFPTRVQRLVLVSPAGLTTEHLRREPLVTAVRLLAAIESRTSARTDLVVRRPRARRAALQFVFRYPEKLSPALVYELVQGAGTPGFLPALEAILDYSYRDRLSQIEVPVLLVWGRNDMMVPVTDADRYERLIGPNARKVIFEDTGHVPMIERPTRFNALLADFLAGEREPGADVAGVTT